MRPRLELHSAALRAFLRGSPGLRAALLAKARAGVAYARSIAPVGTGRYRASLRAELHEGPSRVSARIVADAEDAGLVEHGTSRQPGRRVLGRTVDRIP